MISTGLIFNNCGGGGEEEVEDDDIGIVFNSLSLACAMGPNDADDSDGDEDETTRIIGIDTIMRSRTDLTIETVKVQEWPRRWHSWCTCDRRRRRRRRRCSCTDDDDAMIVLFITSDINQ
jgi:hypothetical protein